MISINYQNLYGWVIQNPQKHSQIAKSYIKKVKIYQIGTKPKVLL